MKSLPILLALALVGVGATYAVAHAPDRSEHHEDAQEQASDRACPHANATAWSHASEHSRLFRCDLNATAPTHHEGAGHADDDNETDDDENETDEAAEHASQGADHANERAGNHPEARDADDDE